MINILCALCGNKQKTKILYPATFKEENISAEVYSARRVPDRIHYRIVKCYRCGLIFSNPIFEEGKISSFYKKSNFMYEMESKYLRKTYGRYLQRIIVRSNTKNLKLLEVGCGNGFFLQEAKDLGIEDVYGIEPGKLSVDKANPEIKKNIMVDMLRPGLFKDETFDIICCFHTLDHVVEPNTFLKIVNKLLKKGGKAFFIVHDTDGISVRLFGESSPIFDIEHIFLFNKKNLVDIFVRQGFEIDEVSDLVNTYPFVYWLKMTGLPHGVKIIGERFLKMLRVDNLPITLTGGNIYLVAKKS